MKTTRILRCLMVLTCAIAVPDRVLAQEPRVPAGNWRSSGHVTYTNPALTEAEFYLNIDVAADGTFKGEWSRYFCTVQAGAYGVSIFSCTRTGGDQVSGRFGPGRQGSIDLVRLGRSAFTWTTPTADELAIDLPKNWQGREAILHRARLTRDGKPKPAAPSSSTREEGPPPSAVTLYREFVKDERGALQRYAGKTLVLEGRRGALISLSDGGAAIHVTDGFQPRALVLVFADLKQASRIAEGALFRFRCTFEHFDYQYVSMKDCAIVP